MSYNKNMRKVMTAGGIVLRGGAVLLIEKSRGIYSLPKGHLLDGETTQEAAIRELREETGYRVSIVKDIGSLTRPSTENTGEAVIKEIRLYRMEAHELTDGDTDETSRWVDIDEALTHMKFDEEREFLAAYISRNAL